LPKNQASRRTFVISARLELSITIDKIFCAQSFLVLTPLLNH